MCANDIMILWVSQLNKTVFVSENADTKQICTENQAI